MDPDQKLLQDQGHPGKNGEISFETKTLGVEESQQKIAIEKEGLSLHSNNYHSFSLVNSLNKSIIQFL